MLSYFKIGKSLMRYPDGRRLFILLSHFPLVLWNERDVNQPVRLLDYREVREHGFHFHSFLDVEYLSGSS